ncbi:formylglycine-generating enzyme family protein [Roseisolibacter sp. H3M3-2]|uniref:formylglycine-generating enzyme family protein n=1 Tax=Roseisolibacter sp. H3M3-2 TaxID=3031323 RepID=UPI0023DC0A43|nr:formylglycine-generating enzyme family protein [Roseisolibacter sp. H3M3-2]MDF1501378.1 formylglycine-generating enzyme family protein [Roseisolibacter sp. H3M3-2]
MRRLAAVLALLALAPRAGAAADDAAGRRPGAEMVRLPAGTYRPLYGRPGDAPTAVAAFRLDRDAATRGEFLAFVRERPEWRRGAVRPLFADRRGYLADWAGDLDAGDATDRRRPVTGVSWFAAKAYCAWRGKRLPTVHEWEYAAAASATRRDAGREPWFVQDLLTRYTTRPRPLPALPAGAGNLYGVRGLHGLAWEWTADFNSVLVSDDSRGVGARDHDLFCASAAVGATDPGNYPAFLRYALRAGLTGRAAVETLGVRCAA